MVKKIKISCFAKLHAFNLAEQLDKDESLSSFYTAFYSKKNTIFRNLNRRVDKEKINNNKVVTAIPLAILRKLIGQEVLVNNLFDKWVANQIQYDSNFDVFIGWSGMSLQTLRKVKKLDKLVILERGSTHIQYQDKILNEEYKQFNSQFNIDSRVIQKELREYEECDFISIPSNFVRDTFIEYGVPEGKLIVNPYGTSNLFHNVTRSHKKGRFIILYLGVISIRKGFKYFYESILELNIPKENYEVWVLGDVAEEMLEYVNNIEIENIRFWGHIEHNQLPSIITRCDIAVQPSLEEGMSMVLLQILACGVPVIATTNTGAGDVIVDEFNGFVIPIRSSSQIKDKLEFCYNHPELLESMKVNAANSIKDRFTWDAYGERYRRFLSTLM
jgi:glycosyltransferase involved in cell wall biosynthesis